MVIYNQTRNLTGGAITLKDGTGSPKTLLVPIDEGNLRFTRTRPAAIVKNRSALSHFTRTPDVEVPIQFTVKFTEWKGKGFTGANPSVVDALSQEGNAASWVSTSLCGPYTVDISFALANPCTGAVAGTDQAEVLDFADFHADTIEFNEGPEYNTLVVSGRSLVTKPTSTRSGS